MNKKLFFIHHSNGQDLSVLRAICKALHPLVQQKSIEIWSTEDIPAGANMQAETDRALAAADWVLPLVSTDYLFDKDCQSLEKRAVQAGKSFLPVLLRPCMYEFNEIIHSNKQLPIDSMDSQLKPVSQWKDRDEAVQVVVRGIWERVKSFEEKKELEIATFSEKNTIFVGASKNLENIQSMAENNFRDENGHALLIGINYNNDEKKRLKGAVNDIKDIGQHFASGDKAAFIAKNMICLLEEKATYQNILTGLGQLAQKANENSSVIIYYAGHGLLDGLLTYDGKTFESGLLAQKIAAIKARKVLVILDCCHSENLAVVRGGDSSLPLDNILKALNGDVTTRGVDAEVIKGEGRVILASCRADEKALDVGTNGLFTQVLLECLNGTPNLKNDGWVRLMDLMDYVPMEVAKRATRYTNKQTDLPWSQHPIFRRIEGLGEEFIICAYDMMKARGGNVVTSKNDIVNDQKNMDKQQVLDLIDTDIDKAFETLDTIFEMKGPYKRLSEEWYKRPNNFEEDDYRSRLKRFIIINWK